MELIALETIIPYPDENTNTGEVGEKLEKKYKIVETFYKRHEQDFQEQFMKYFSDYMRRTNDYKTSFEKSVRDCEAWLRNKYIDYILSDKTGYKTKASRERGSASFVDTGNYYSNLFFEIRK